MAAYLLTDKKYEPFIMGARGAALKGGFYTNLQMWTVGAYAGRQAFLTRELHPACETYTPGSVDVDLLRPTTTSEQDLTLVGEIEAMYSIENKDEVFGFIRQHDFLKPLIQQAYPRIQESFPEAEVHLELVEDPEIEELTHLVAFVMVEDEPDEFFPKLSRMQREWLAALVKNAKQRFIFDVELI